MYYINSSPNETGNHGNPMGQPFPNCVTLPDDLLSPYLAAKGFVALTVEDGAVTSLETNQEELDAYEADHPDLPPEEPEEPVTWGAMAAAIREGVNDVD